MEFYLVGGAVRDKLLGIEVHEQDWLVLGGDAEKLQKLGFSQLDPEFPVFIHPETSEEYALARIEKKVSAGYRGFAFDVSGNITLEQDLVRRDLTINAIAKSTAGQLYDPFSGQKDIEAGLLRHVSDSFAEDPVRILRIARFAAKLGQDDFHVAHSTHHLLIKMVQQGAMQELQAERIGQEMQKSLRYEQPWRFFEVLNAIGALDAILPKLATLMLKHETHGNRVDSMPIQALKRAVALSNSADFRFAVLWASCGDTIDNLLSHIVVPKTLRALAERTASAWQDWQQLDSAEEAWNFLNKYKAWQKLGQFKQILLLLKVMDEQDVNLAKIQKSFEAVQGVTSERLLAQGVSGASLGKALNEQRKTAVLSNW